MTSLDTLASRVAADQGELWLRLPFELIFDVLKQLAATSKQKHLMYMRLVSRAFDDQILRLVFDGRGFRCNERLMNGAAWNSSPESLRHKYLYHLLNTRQVKSNAFAYVAVPVFEAEIAHLSLEGNEATTRVRQWCTLPMHEFWKLPRGLPSLMTHRRSTFAYHKARVEQQCQFMTGRWERISDTDDAARKRRIDHDRQFLRILLHILEDEQEAVLNLLFPATFVCPDEFNLCFGTTILGFAIRWGTLSTVKELLKRIPETSEDHLGVYLKLAVRRRDVESYTISALLLDQFRSAEIDRWAFVEHIITRAVEKAGLRGNKGSFPGIRMLWVDSQVVIRNILRWITSISATPSLLKVLETSFKRLDPYQIWPQNAREERTLLLQEAMPKAPGNSMTMMPEMSPLSAFTTGVYYKHRALREIVRGHRQPTVYRYNCPCLTDSMSGRFRGCNCRDTEWCRCKIALYGFTLPYFREPRRWGSMISSAARAGLVNWVDWFLWAGADPKNEPQVESLLFWARCGGIRQEVIQLLLKHDYDLMNLTIQPNEPIGCTTQQRHETGPEVWAAGSERRDSLVMAMFDESHSDFWIMNS